nr:hypothetical protein [Tanacetum cinerariifolium]
MSNTLHNAIMEASSKDRPLMLAPGNYVQWKSRIKRYIDTKPNQELIYYCLTNPPYELARKCQKLKRAKDEAYHKEKMLLFKQEESGFQLNAEQTDWRDDTDDKPDDQELEAHYMYMAQIQEVTPDAADNSRPIFDS